MKIIFTSCTRYEAFNEQPEWELISNQNPDYLFLLGDNIYMDYGIPLLSDEPVGISKRYSNQKFEEVMKQKYYNQFNLVPEFKELVETMRSKGGFFATWDDHDFAWDNAKGVNVPEEKKKISRALFHEYLDCSTNLPHLYYHVDTEYARIIFLDNRTDAEEKGRNSRILSEAQFAFIKEKLEHNLKYTILCGGLTLTEGSENWSNYPSQLKELCNLMKEVDNVIYLGGDIHQNRFVKSKRIENLDITTPVQLISSGMQVNYFGLGIPLDDQHNWAMLELYTNYSKVSFFDKNGMQKRLSKKATKFLNKYLIY